MSDSPTPTNGAATIANNVLHTLIFDVAVKAAQAALEAEFPWLRLIIVHQLEESLINIIADQIYQELAKGVTFAIIDVQVNAEAAAVNKAKENLINALKGDNVDAVTKATNDFESAFGKLIHYDGSATP